MDDSTILTGDQIDVTSVFAASPTTSKRSEHGSPWVPGRFRAYVTVIDLSDAGRASRRTLKARVAVAAADAERHGTLAHFVVLYRTGGHFPSRSLALASSLAQSVQARFERELGDFIDVVFVDVTGCADADLLSMRLITHIRRAPSAAAACAVRWNTLRESSISAVAATDYF